MTHRLLWGRRMFECGNAGQKLLTHRACATLLPVAEYSTCLSDWCSEVTEGGRSCGGRKRGHRKSNTLTHFCVIHAQTVSISGSQRCVHQRSLKYNRGTMILYNERNPQYGFKFIRLNLFISQVPWIAFNPNLQTKNWTYRTINNVTFWKIRPKVVCLYKSQEYKMKHNETLVRFWQ